MAEGDIPPNNTLAIVGLVLGSILAVLLIAFVLYIQSQLRYDLQSFSGRRKLGDLEAGQYGLVRDSEPKPEPKETKAKVVNS